MQTRHFCQIERSGKKLFGMLHLPSISAKSAPLVICFHGFVSNKLGTQRSHVQLADALSAAGLAAVRFDLGGHGDSEGDLSEMGLMDLLEDAIAIACHYRELGYENMGFFGTSLGGSLAILAAHHLATVKALALWAPVASGMLWARDNPQPIESYRGSAIGPLFRDQFLKMQADRALLELKAVPLWHGQGQQDEVLSIDHKRAFEIARSDATALSRFLLFANTAHSLGAADCKVRVHQECVAWFSRFLY